VCPAVGSKARCALLLVAPHGMRDALDAVAPLALVAHRKAPAEHAHLAQHGAGVCDGPLLHAHAAARHDVAASDHAALDRDELRASGAAPYRAAEALFDDDLDAALAVLHRRLHLAAAGEDSALVGAIVLVAHCAREAAWRRSCASRRHGRRLSVPVAGGVSAAGSFCEQR